MLRLYVGFIRRAAIGRNLIGPVRVPIRKEIRGKTQSSCRRDGSARSGSALDKCNSLLTSHYEIIFVGLQFSSIEAATLHDFRRAHATYHYGEVTDRGLKRQIGNASDTKYAETHRQTPYVVHRPTLAKAQAQGLKITSDKHVGGQAADNARMKSATA